MDNNELRNKALAIREILHDCSVTEALSVLSIVTDGIFKVLRKYENWIGINKRYQITGKKIFGCLSGVPFNKIKHKSRWCYVHNWMRYSDFKRISKIQTRQLRLWWGLHRGVWLLCRMPHKDKITMNKNGAGFLRAQPLLIIYNLKVK